MGLPAVGTATTMCSFGAAPGVLNAIPMGVPVTIENKPAATIQDSKPFVNIPPFGVCMSLSNPATASLTAAALGVLTPGPCTPITTPWTPGSPTVMINGQPALTAASKCNCAYGGVISISFGGAVVTNVP